MGKDHPPILPVARKPVKMLVEESVRYALAAPEAEAEWIWTGPVGDHAIRLGTGQHAFAIAMFHQLHCLDVLRVAFVTKRDKYRSHVEHCLRYLRPHILCNADATLEPAEVGERDGELLHSSTGYGAGHRCKDWTVLRRYLEEHPAALPTQMQKDTSAV